MRVLSYPLEHDNPEATDRNIKDTYTSHPMRGRDRKLVREFINRWHRVVLLYGQ